MPNSLIIVESPTKARTLGRFLGSEYTIRASMGHVRDLPERGLGVDIENAFRPEYEVTKEKAVKELRAAAKKADFVLLASDPDREGEAIAWHLAEALKLRDPDRVVIHEITRPAVEAALRAPRKIDRDLVYAQEARRVIDRLVGYQLSPLLWKKVSGGGRRRLSAGRVQSVAVRLVVDREREIEGFVTEESWSVDAVLVTDTGDELTARLFARRGDAAEEEEEGDDRREAAGRDGSRLVLTDEAAALDVMRALGVDEEGRPGDAASAFVVAAVVARQRTRNPPAPFTTSTLQQDASTRLRYSPGRTMRVAQQLYEGVDLGADGPVGLITYMRTDSTRISPLAREAAVAHITEAFGAPYVGSGAAKPGRKQAPVEAQDAHEAIRPTDPARTPESVASHLSEEQRRLYDLIWRRFAAGQMAPARFDTTRADIEAGDFVFRASGSVLRFDGYLRVLRRDDNDDRNLPALTRGQQLRLTGLEREQHFTQPPPRYTEASLIKELEERGIGRPSTYATILDTIQERKYVGQEDRRLAPTPLGITVDGVLREHFPDVVDVDFTADLERRLDSIEGGSRGFEPTVREWYDGFSQELTRAEQGMERVRVPARPTGEACPECGEGELVMRDSRYGECVGCSRYPECRYVRREAGATPTPTGETCPKCGKDLVVRKSRRGPFVGCTGYPDCRYIQPRGGDGAAGASTGSRPAPVPIDRACPDCGKPLVVRTGRRGPFVGCSGYPKCRHTEGDAPELGRLTAAAAGAGAPEADGGGLPATARRGPAAEPAPDLGACPECGKVLVRRQGRFGQFVSCSGYPTCRFRPPKGGAAA